jgi:hypothetical protein
MRLCALVFALRAGTHSVAPCPLLSTTNNELSILFYYSKAASFRSDATLTTCLFTQSIGSQIYASGAGDPAQSPLPPGPG